MHTEAYLAKHNVILMASTVALALRKLAAYHEALQAHRLPSRCNLTRKDCGGTHV
jgi:hypothetical protein